MIKPRLATSGLLAVLLLLSIALLALSACGSGSSPEGVVRAYIDAVNARDKAKFVSLWSPDKRDSAASYYDGLIQSKWRFLEVKTIVVRDSLWVPKGKEVTVQVREEYSTFGGGMAQSDMTHVFYVEQLNGHWYISLVV
jgi:hypothetical protein